MNFNIPDLGIIDGSSGFRNLPSTTDGRFTSGEDGVKHIVCTGDGKVEFVAFENQTLAYVNSALGYGAYYPLHPVNRNGKIKAVLMDLDGTSVRLSANHAYRQLRSSKGYLLIPSVMWKYPPLSARCRTRNRSARFN